MFQIKVDTEKTPFDTSGNKKIQLSNSINFDYLNEQQNEPNTYYVISFDR